MKTNFLHSVSVRIAVMLLIAGLSPGVQARAACAVTASDLHPQEKAVSVPVRLGRGVNLSRYWEDDKDRAPSADDLETIGDVGFNFVRLPISPTWLHIKDKDDQTEKLADLRCDIVTLLAARLDVVLDLHPSDVWDTQLKALKPDKAEERIEDFWRQMAPVIDGLPTDRVLISLYNEPEFETDLWWRMQNKLIKDLRPVFPRSTFVVTVSPDGGWWKLVEMEPYADANLIYDFHFYEPMVLTHHGAEWLKGYTKAKASLPITYPYDSTTRVFSTDPDMRAYAHDNWNRNEIDQLIHKVALWRDAHHVEVACLEFGVYREHLDDQSRLNWLHDVRAEFDMYHLPWALWEYRGPFGFIDSGRDFDEEMAKALGLRHSAAP